MKPNHADNAMLVLKRTIFKFGKTKRSRENRSSPPSLSPYFWNKDKNGPLVGLFLYGIHQKAVAEFRPRQIKMFEFRSGGGQATSEFRSMSPAIIRLMKQKIK